MPNRFRAAVAKTAPKATKTITLSNVFINCDKPVVLHCRHAGFSNPATTNVSLKAGPARAAVIKDTEPSTIERTLAVARIDAKTLAPAVVNWDNALDEENKPYPASPELVEELFLAMIDEQPDDFLYFRSWVNDQSNFTEAPLAGAADLGK